MERPDEYERAVKHWALLEADERNKNALPPDLWVFSLRQASIEGSVSVRFKSLATMELAVTDAMWHGHADIDKWIGLVWTESKIDQSKSASDVEYVAKAVPFRIRHHDGSTTLYFSDVAIAQNEVGLLAGKCDMAALLTDIQMSPTFTTCRVLQNMSPIVWSTLVVTCLHV
jgi:hypothetical protein